MKYLQGEILRLYNKIEFKKGMQSDRVILLQFIFPVTEISSVIVIISFAIVVS